MTLAIATALLILSGCEDKPVMSHSQFKHLPTSGWQRVKPLTFNPEYDDSTATYDLRLAVRHDNTYRYCNLSLIVDIIATDSTMSRYPLDIALADEYGNWSGGGFGTLYQDEVVVVSGISPDDARSLVVWQAMEGCDTLFGLVNVGIIVNPQ
jgi:gliding motility-associated lipoprotein GldH